MSYHQFNLDHLAQEIVLRARKRDNDSLNQAHKMRAACAFGLERFWGEHLRLSKDEPTKAAFVADVWKGLVGVLAKGSVNLPADVLFNNDDEARIQSVAESIWRLGRFEQQTALAVLIALCDAIVWWTQRLKLPARGSANE